MPDMLLIPPLLVCLRRCHAAAASGGVGAASELRFQLIASPNTFSAGLIGKAPLISPWMISGIERPLRIDISSIRS